MSYRIMRSGFVITAFFFVISGCKKNTSGPAPGNSIDSFAGAYKGSLHISEYNSLSGRTITDTLYADTFSVNKISNDSFFCTLPGSHLSLTGGRGYEYNDSNIYSSVPGGPAFELMSVKIFPGNNSIYYQLSISDPDGSIGYTSYQETFSGKK